MTDRDNASQRRSPRLSEQKDDQTPQEDFELFTDAPDPNDPLLDSSMDTNDTNDVGDSEAEGVEDMLEEEELGDRTLVEAADSSQESPSQTDQTTEDLTERKDTPTPPQWKEPQR